MLRVILVIQGSTGAQGAAGSKGNTGSTGAQGAAGSNGSTGAQGATGSKGNTGSTGAQGATGSKGNTGSTGAQGATGSKGNTGSTGAQGATGSTGAQGASGGGGSISAQHAYNDRGGLLTGITVYDRGDQDFGIDQITFQTTEGNIIFYDDSLGSGGGGFRFTAGHMYQAGENLTGCEGMALSLINNKVYKSREINDKRVIGFLGEITSGKDSITNTINNNLIYVIGIGDSYQWRTVRDFDDNGEILVEKRYICGLKVCNEGGNISVGDLICTSSTPGYFMKQADDIVHNYTAGKCMQHIIFDSTGKKENIYCIMMCG